MKKQKTNYTILLTAITIVVIVALLSIYYYQSNNGPLPYEENYEEMNAEQGLSGLDYEYTGPNLENLPPSRQLPSN